MIRETRMARAPSGLVAPAFPSCKGTKAEAEARWKMTLCWIWFNMLCTLSIVRMLAHGENGLGDATLTLWNPFALYHHHSPSHSRLSWVLAGFHTPTLDLQSLPQMGHVKPFQKLRSCLDQLLSFPWSCSDVCSPAPLFPKKAPGPSASR